MKNQSVLTVNALAAVLVGGGLLSACAGESAGEPVEYDHQQPQRSDAEQTPRSDYDRPLPNPAQPVPPVDEPGGGDCNDLCSGAGTCASHCLSSCDEVPLGCEKVARKIAKCMQQLGGDCNAALFACWTQHALEVAVCAGEDEDETGDPF